MKEEEKKSFLKVCTLQIVFLKAYLKDLFFINNKLSLADRLIYKSITRQKLKLDNNEFDILTNTNVDNSIYLKYSTRIQQIHNELLTSCLSSNFKLVEFENIEDGINKCYNIYYEWGKNYNFALVHINENRNNIGNVK